MLLVVAAIIFKFYRKFYCKFYCTCDQSISEAVDVQTYRLYVLLKLPQLHDLDMTTVTAADRTEVAVLRGFNLIKRN